MIAPNQAPTDFLAALSRAHRGESSHRPARLKKRDRHVLHASYDAAQTTELNKKYWANADSLSADQANSPEVRATLRSRARYECHESDSVLKGVVHTLANDVIGTGPKLQMQLRDQQINREIERHFHAWCREVQLARKLRTMRIAKLVDGEAFAQLTTNRRLRHRVKLNVRLFEAERCASPWLYQVTENEIDGIQFDPEGNPVEYMRLKYHPGGPEGFRNQVDRLPAERVIHLFRQDRPEQHRGIPEITPALPLAALRRDYILAVLHNVRTNAKFTGVLQTKASSTTENGNAFDPDVEAFDAVDVDYDMLTSLPHGWELKQFASTHPMATFEMFVRVITSEMGRCILMPYGITAANSSGYNYSSGRLDHQAYFHAIDVDRSEIELECLDRIFTEWLDEAILTGLIPAELGEDTLYLPHCWFWDSRGHVDPQKEATAQRTRLSSGTSHRAAEYAAEGKDIDVEDQIAAAGYGVTVEEYRQGLFQSTFAQQGQQVGGTPDNADSEDSAETDSVQATADPIGWLAHPDFYR